MIPGNSKHPKCISGPDTDPELLTAPKEGSGGIMCFPVEKRPPRLGRCWDERSGPVEPVAIRGSTAHLKRRNAS